MHRDTSCPLYCKLNLSLSESSGLIDEKNLIFTWRGERYFIFMLELVFGEGFAGGKLVWVEMAELYN